MVVFVGHGEKGVTTGKGAINDVVGLTKSLTLFFKFIHGRFYFALFGVVWLCCCVCFVRFFVLFCLVAVVFAEQTAGWLCLERDVGVDGD